MDKFWTLSPSLAKDGVFVHTTLRRFESISWNRKKIAVTLHRRKESDDTDNKI